MSTFRPLAFAAAFACVLPLSAQAQVSTPKLASCADLSLASSAIKVGRDMVAVTLKLRNEGPGAYAGKRGEQWVEYVITVNGKEVERKKEAFVTLGVGLTRDFTFNRAKADGDFGVWAMIMYAPGLATDQNSENDDCNEANNSAVLPVTF